jgi:hypothetical protein
MKKRDTPKSVERQMQQRNKTAELPEAKPYDYANMPDDLPSVEYWYKVRDAYLFQQERLSQPG